MSFFTRKIFDSQNKAFGLDISDLSVKVAALEENGGRRSVAGFGTYPIARGSVVNGDIINKKNVIFSIKKALEKSGPRKIKNRKVICALPETKAFLRIISIPQMEEGEICEAIKWEIEANIPLAIDQVYYDWRLLEEANAIPGEKKLSILVVAVAQKVADQFIEVVEGAGLQLMGLEVESLAQSRSLIREKTEKDKTTFVIDLGDRVVGFIAALGNTPRFTSNIPLSSQSIADAISKGMGISMEEAEKMEETAGIGSFLEQDPVFKAVQPVLDSLVAEIERSMDFYLTSLRYSNSIDKIVVCGGGTNIKGLVSYLSSKLGREVEVGDPLVNFFQKKVSPVVGQKELSHYSTTIGLALRGLSPYENIY